MTRTRNGSYHGVSIFDADPDAVAFAKCLRETVQDFNLAYDMATGENGISSSVTMNHNGTAGRGALLGFPVINQHIGRRMSYDAADVTTYGSDVILLAAPLFVPAGEETGWRFEIVTSDGVRSQPVVEIYDSSGTLLYTTVTWPDDTIYPGRVVHAAHAMFSTTSAVVYVMVRYEFSDSDSSWLLHGWNVYVERQHVDRGFLIPGTTAGFPVPTAGAGQALNVETICDEMLADNFAVAGHIVNKLNRNISALWEWLTGAPVPGNTDVTNDDNAGTDPTVSRFAAHTAATLSSEPQIDFPLVAEALGAVSVNGTMLVDATPVTDGLRPWHAPFPVDTATSTGRRLYSYVPDFPASGAGCSLKVAVIAANDTLKAAWSGTWQARASVGGDASPWITFSQLGSLPFYAGVATFTAFTGADDATEILLETKSSGSFTFGEFAPIGWALYFDP